MCEPSHRETLIIYIWQSCEQVEKPSPCVCVCVYARHVKICIQDFLEYFFGFSLSPLLFCAHAFALYLEPEKVLVSSNYLTCSLKCISLRFTSTTDVARYNACTTAPKRKIALNTKQHQIVEKGVSIKQKTAEEKVLCFGEEVKKK